MLDRILPCMLSSYRDWFISKSLGGWGVGGLAHGSSLPGLPACFLSLHWSGKFYCIGHEHRELVDDLRKPLTKQT